MHQGKSDTPNNLAESRPKANRAIGFLEGMRHRVRNLTMLSPVLAVLAAGSVSCNDHIVTGNTYDAAEAGMDSGPGPDRGSDPKDSAVQKDIEAPDRSLAKDTAIPDSEAHDIQQYDTGSHDVLPPDLEVSDAVSHDSTLPDTGIPDSGSQDVLSPDKGADSSSDSSVNCPKILDFSLNTAPTGGKVLSGGVNYMLRLPLTGIDTNGSCKIWAESSNKNDAGLLNGSSAPITISPYKIAAGGYMCSPTYTTPVSDFGHTVTFYTEITNKDGCVITQTSVSYTIEMP